MNRRVVWVLLCEDEQHYSFALRFLSKLSVPELRLHRKVLGPGHQGVRARLGAEVLAIRKQGGRAGLLAIMDADGQSVAKRRSYARQLCEGDQVPMESDPVAVLIPERNIETWITWLDGNVVDATSRYRKLERQRDCEPAVRKLKLACDSGGLPPGAPPSLVDACREFQRVLSILTS